MRAFYVSLSIYGLFTYFYHLAPTLVGTRVSALGPSYECAMLSLSCFCLLNYIHDVPVCNFLSIRM